MKFIQAANHWVGREGYRPRYLIVHGTAGGSSAEAIANYFANPATQASTHYVIGTDGEVVQCVNENDAAWANGGFSWGHDAFWNENINPNLISISIEHCKPNTDNSNQLTEPQKAASFRLVKDICDRWGIPMRKADAGGGITGHYSIDPVNRGRCPGPYPFDELFNFLTNNSGASDMLQITDPFAKQYFSDKGGGRWHCNASNQDVIGAILTFYRQIQGSPRLPKTGEQYDIKDVVYQVFEAGIICYDPKRVLDGPSAFYPCYLVKLDSDLGTRLLTGALQQQLNTAKADLVATKAQLTDEQKATAQALAAAKAAEAQATTDEAKIKDLEAQLAQAQSAQHVDMNAVSSDLANALNMINDLKAKFNLQ